MDEMIASLDFVCDCSCFHLDLHICHICFHIPCICKGSEINDSTWHMNIVSDKHVNRFNNSWEQTCCSAVRLVRLSRCIHKDESNMFLLSHPNDVKGFSMTQNQKIELYINIFYFSSWNKAVSSLSVFCLLVVSQWHVIKP